MTLKLRLKDFLQSNDKSQSLKEIYQAFPESSKSSIRAVLNSNIKNSYFVREGKGFYK